MVDLAEALKNVAVIGAAGKMGAGISALILLEVAKESAQKTGTLASGYYAVHLIDSQKQAFDSLRSYLDKQLRKFAEKNLANLRSWLAPSLTADSDQEIIHRFVSGAMSLIRCSTDLDAAKDSFLIFEAIVEDEHVKAQVFRSLAHSPGHPYFLTNTSSIPIHVLNQEAKLEGRIAGFHFYNPPLVQELLEIILPASIDPTLPPLAQEIAKRMGKTIVYSRDIAGFIGNGYLIREIAFALQLLQELSAAFPMPQALCLINRATEEFLLRPMGIFQLIDYVGIDVVIKISNIMHRYIPSLHIPLKILEQMAAFGHIGGYDSSSNRQKEGFFRYNSHEAESVFSFEDRAYLPLNPSTWKKTCAEELGRLPFLHCSWKELKNDPEKMARIHEILSYVANNQGLGSDIARKFLRNSCAIAEGLIRDGVAAKLEDVDIVLRKGFYHLYGLLDIEDIKGFKL